MRKTKLPDRELEICHRLRFARERCDLDQASCARQIGLGRSTLLNYEHRRTPLRFDTALRFCRQFIISEEWLATGRYDACHAASVKRGVPPGSEMNVMNNLIFMRQCMDLGYEPACRQIPPGTLFSEAYDKFLAPEYGRLVVDFFYLPRIIVTDFDNPELALNLLHAVNERFVGLLNNEALRRGQKHSSAWRRYARCLLDSSDLVFRKMMGFHLDLERLHHFDWIRASVTDPDFKIAFLEDRPSGATTDSPKDDLTEAESLVTTGDVKALLPQLLERLKKASSAPGKKSELAKFLGVPLASVSRWLSGEREPGGEITLKLFHWVEQQERQK